MAADTLTERCSVVRARTHVMSCDAAIAVTFDPESIDGDDLARRAVARLAELEQRWSRFLARSEISELNATPGVQRRVSPDTFRLVEALVQAWHATGGAFDPTLLGAVVHLGYGTSRERADLTTSLAPGTEPRGRPARSSSEPPTAPWCCPPAPRSTPVVSARVSLPTWSSTSSSQAGARGALVEIGGDMRVRGIAPSGSAWPISIADTGDVVEVADGGIATSTTSPSDLDHGRSQTSSPHRPGDAAEFGDRRRDLHGDRRHGCLGRSIHQDRIRRGAAQALADYEAGGLAASITTSAGVVTTSTWKEFTR